MKIKRVLLVHKKSLYRLYVQEHKHVAVKRALRQGDPIAKRMHTTHLKQQKGLQRATELLINRGFEVVERWRADIRTAAGYDLVVTFGGDGTLLDTSHRIISATPLMGINSDPTSSVGALCAGTVNDLSKLIDGLCDGSRRPHKIPRMRIRVDGAESLGPCLNDVLFAHCCPAKLSSSEVATLSTSKLTRDGRFAGRRRLFPMSRNSGVWVATGSGSTAAIRSAGGRVMSRGSRQLQYLIREPYLRPNEQPPPSRGMIKRGEALVLVSRVRRGMLWADGPYRRLAIAYGQTIICDEHPSPLHLV